MLDSPRLPHSHHQLIVRIKLMRYLPVVCRQCTSLLAVALAKRAQCTRRSRVRKTRAVFDLVIARLVGGDAHCGALSGEGGLTEMPGLCVLGAHGEGCLLTLCAGSFNFVVLVTGCIGSVVWVAGVASEGCNGAVAGVVVVASESGVLYNVRGLREQ
jgi:hypothetical protein